MNNKLLNKRNINRKRAEKRFQLYGIVSIILAVAFLAVLIGSMLVKSLPAFTQTLILLEIHLDRAEIDPNFTDRPDIIGRADYRKIAKKAILSEFPSVKTLSLIHI